MTAAELVAALERGALLYRPVVDGLREELMLVQRDGVRWLKASGFGGHFRLEVTRRLMNVVKHPEQWVVVEPHVMPNTDLRECSICGYHRTMAVHRFMMALPGSA